MSELNSEEIRKFLERNMVSRWDAIHAMLFSDKSCGLLEVWDYTKSHDGNKIFLTYELDKTVPYGEIHTIFRR